jgi:ectoine hydroxylase-related dioxygenase (phytanoyl-CoA dioxygenase family)
MDTARILRQIGDQGFAVVEGVIPLVTCRRLSERLEALAASYAGRYAHASNTAAVHGTGDARLVYNLHNKGAEFLELIFHETVLSVARSLLSDRSYQGREPFQLALSQARGLYGPNAPQQLHIDSYIPGLPVAMVLQAGWALSDFVRGSGATCFVPGSHRTASFPETGCNDGMVEVEAPAGSLMLFSGAVWHGSSAKSDPGARWGVFNRYSRWFMRPSFDLTACTPESVYSRLSAEQREILGFRFRAPKDEFTRVTRISPVPEFEPGYALPDTDRD